MADDDIEPPTRVEVTARFLADNREKRVAYAFRRKMWIAGFTGASTARAQPLNIRPTRGRIHDARQGKLDL